MRGVLLAGSTGSRLWPITRAVSKQLMPVFDKPMVYYPLSTLVMAGVPEVLVITAPGEQSGFRRLLGDGSQWGLRLSYAVQPRPQGVAQALQIAADHLAGGPVALILGDNIFHGTGLARQLHQHREVEGAVIFAYPVANPTDYVVVELDEDGLVRSIEERPAAPRSRYAVSGLYFYDGEAAKIASSLRRSTRGELQTTAVHEEYLRRGQLRVEVLSRGTAWLDTGTFGSLVAASEYVRVVEERQGFKIGCVEEAAWRAGLIPDDQLRELAAPLRRSGYGDYLLRLLEWPGEPAGR